MRNMVWFGCDDVGDATAGVDVDGIDGLEHGERLIFVDEILGGFVDAAGGEDVGDATGGVAEGVTGEGVEDDGRLADGDSAGVERGR